MSSAGLGADLGARAIAGLGRMTPRRFEILLTCCSLSERFTAHDVREQLSDSELGASLLRDLKALEAGGWLTADPPASHARQGKIVRYVVTDLTVLAWQALHQLVSDARSTTCPSPAAASSSSTA